LVFFRLARLSQQHTSDETLDGKQFLQSVKGKCGLKQTGVCLTSWLVGGVSNDDLEEKNIVGNVRFDSWFRDRIARAGTRGRLASLGP